MPTVSWRMDKNEPFEIALIPVTHFTNSKVDPVKNPMSLDATTTSELLRIFAVPDASLNFVVNHGIPFFRGAVACFTPVP